MIIPYQTGCLSCAGIDNYEKYTLNQRYLMIYHKPKLPEHCVIIVLESEEEGYWKKTFPGR
jgi:hypothetical protein